MFKFIVTSFVWVLFSMSAHAQFALPSVEYNLPKEGAKPRPSAGSQASVFSKLERELSVLEADLTREAQARDTKIASKRIQLAEKYHKNRKYARAETLVKEAISAGEQAFQGALKTYVHGLIVLSNVYRNTGRTEYAAALCDRVLPMLKNTHAKKSPYEYAHNVFHCGRTYSHSSQYQRGNDVMRNALRLYKQHAGKEHHLLSVVLHELGNNYMRQRNVGLALKEYNLAQAHFEKYPPPTAPFLGKSALYQGLGLALSELGRDLERAEKLLRKSLALRVENLPESDIRIAQSNVHVGAFLLQRNRAEEGLPFLEKALPIYEVTFGPRHEATQHLLQRLKGAYARSGQVEKSQVVHRRLAQMPPKDKRAIDIYYATNRNFIEQSQNRPIATFGSHDTDVLKFGRARIYASRSEVQARADRVADGGGLIEQSRGLLTSIDKLKIVKVRKFDNAPVFSGSAKETLRYARGFKNQAIIFVHGYNVNFEGALQRTAQIAFDLDFDGLLVAFSWPSKRKVSQYLSDTASADVAVEHLLEFIEMLQARMPDTKIHFIAHSMGNRILLRALERISDRRGPERLVPHARKFGELILAHADIDAQRCRQLLKNVRPIAQGITLYVHKADWALWFSNKLRSRKRCGAETVVYEGVDTIDTSQMRADKNKSSYLPQGWNHDVFVQNSLLFNEISRLLRTGSRPPTKRTPEFKELTTPDGQTYWAYDPKRDLLASSAN